MRTLTGALLALALILGMTGWANAESRPMKMELWTCDDLGQNCVRIDASNPLYTTATVSGTFNIGASLDQGASGDSADPWFVNLRSAAGADLSGSITNVESYTSRLLSSAATVDPDTALATTSLIAGGQYNATPPTFTDGEQGSIQLNENGAVHTVVDFGGGGGVTDDSAFTQGVDQIVPGGCLYNSPVTPISAGSAGILRCETNHSLWATLRDSSGAELGSSGTPLYVRQYVNFFGIPGAALPPDAVYNGVKIGTDLAGVTGAVRGSETAMSVQLVDASGTQITSFGNSGYAQGSTTSGETGPLVQGAVTTSAPSYTTGQTSPLSLTTTGGLRTSATLSNLEATIAPGTAPSKMAVIGGVYNASSPAPTNGQALALQQDANGALLTNPGALSNSTDSVTAHLAAGTNLIGTAGIDQTTSGTTNAVVPKTNQSGTYSGIIQCDSTALINTASAATTQLVALTSGQTIYVCGWEITTSSASATTVDLTYGTGTNCGTGTTQLSAFVRFPAGVTGLQGKVAGHDFYQGMKTAAANALCVTNSAAVQVDGIVYYTKF